MQHPQFLHHTNVMHNSVQTVFAVALSVTVVQFLNTLEDIKHIISSCVATEHEVSCFQDAKISLSVTLGSHCSAQLHAYLNPGLHSVQVLEVVHFLQFSGHLLQMLESGRQGEPVIHSD